MTVLAIDPGRDKCGLAVVNAKGEVLAREVVPRAQVVHAAVDWWQQHAPEKLLLGDSTGARALEVELRAALPDAALQFVDERGSTLQARELFWQANPPRGWRRVVPLSLQTPPVPLDDFAAVVLAQRYLAE